jgi:hypothetical protein
LSQIAAAVVGKITVPALPASTSSSTPLPAIMPPAAEPLIPAAAGSLVPAAAGSLVPAAAGSRVPARRPPPLSGIGSLPVSHLAAPATVLKAPPPTIVEFLGLLPSKHLVPTNGALSMCMGLLMKHVDDHTKYKVCAVLSAIEKNGGVAAFGGSISLDFLAAFFFLLTSGIKALKKREKSPEFCAACDSLVSAPYKHQVWYVFWYMCEDICGTFSEWYIHSYGHVLASANDLKTDLGREEAMNRMLTHFQSP